MKKYYSLLSSRMVRIKILATVVICMLAVFYTQSVHGRSNEAPEDNDFAEFDDFDADDEFETVSEHSVKTDKQSSGGANNDKNDNDNFQDVYEENDDDDGVVEEESEFEHFRDDEEFEGFSKNDQAAPVDSGTEPKLTMVRRFFCRR